jgi:hypothetical protein
MDVIEKLSIITLPILIAALLTSIIRRNHKDKERFDTAYDIFCAAFADELAFLVSDIKQQSSIRGTAFDILTKALNKHRGAIDTYTRVLPKRKGKGFGEAWDKYLYPDGIKEVRPLIYYAEGNETKQRQEAHFYISKLLEVAKPK